MAEETTKKEEAVLPIKDETVNQDISALNEVDPVVTDINRDEILSRAFRRSSNRIVQIKVFDESTAATTGDGKVIFFIPPEYDELILKAAYAYVTTVSSSGALTIQVRNVTNSQDMLTTAITIDAGEFSSLTAATAPVISLTTSLVRSGDRVAIDVDGAGTGTTGLGLVLAFG